MDILIIFIEKLRHLDFRLSSNERERERGEKERERDSSYIERVLWR